MDKIFFSDGMESLAEKDPWRPHLRHSHTPIGFVGSTGLAGAAAGAGDEEEDLAALLALLPLAPLLAEAEALATAPLLSFRQGPH